MPRMHISAFFLSFAVYLHVLENLELDRQAVAIPPGHEANSLSGEHLVPAVVHSSITKKVLHTVRSKMRWSFPLSENVYGGNAKKNPRDACFSVCVCLCHLH